MQNKVVVLFFLTLISNQYSFSQGVSKIQELVDSTELIIQTALDSNEITGAVTTIVSSDSVWMVKGFGYHSDLKEKQIHPQSSLFRVGSVGKVFTALLAKMYIDSGRLDSDIPVQSYLGDELSSRIGTEPITFDHLLTHTAGLNDRVIGYAARKPEEREELRLHLEVNMPGPFTIPGKVVSYSNYSYALAGYIVEKQVGKSFTDLVSNDIFEPLNMNASGYGSHIDNLDSMVQGYTKKDGKLDKSFTIFPNPIPAGSLITTGSDMTRFQRYLLDIISEFDQSSNSSFKPHPCLGGYSNGFENWQINDIEIYAKGGMVPGFTSLLLIIPDMDISFFISINSTSEHIVDRLSMSYQKILFGDYQKPLTSIEPFVKNETRQFTGSFRLNRLNRQSIAEFFGQMRNTMNIWRRNDTLKIYHDGEIHSYLETEPYIFSDVKNENQKVIFQADQNGKITGLMRDNRIAGSYVPSVYEKIPWYDSNDFLNEWFGVFVLGSLIFILYPIVWLFRTIRNIGRDKTKQFTYSGFIAFLFSFVVIVWIRNYFLFLLQNGSELLYGFPENLELYLNFPVLMIILLILGIINTAYLTKSGLMSKLKLTIYSFHYLSATVFLLVLYRWHFIGNYI